MSGSRTAGVIGAAVGVLTAGAGTAVALQRRRVDRQRHAPDDRAGTPFGKLVADRTRRVGTDDGITLHVEEDGDADAPLVILLVHGYTLTLGSWHYQRIALAGPRRLVVSYDQRSHGRSDRATEDSCDVEQLGRDLLSVIDATAGERPVVLVGHSMGGMTILSLAEQRPELFGGQVCGVALLSTTTGGLAGLDLGLPRFLSPLKLVALPVLARGMRARPKLAEALRRAGSDLSWWLTRVYSFGSPDVSPALVDYVGTQIAETPVEVVADFFGALMGADTVQALPVLDTVPTLVVCGDADRMTPLAHSEAMVHELSHARLVVVPGAGHLAMMERPDVVGAALEELIDQVAPTRGRHRPQ